MTPAEIAERLFELSDEVHAFDREDEGSGVKLNEVVVSLRMIASHAKALPCLTESPADDPSGVTMALYPMVTRPRPGRTFTEVERELSLLAHIVDLDDDGQIGGDTILRMAAWLTDRYGEPDA